jgi:hypothetical protein
MADPRKKNQKKSSKKINKKSRSGNKTRTPDINFDKAFLKGPKTYNTQVGEWWEGQASNPAHQRAYREMASQVKDTLATAFGDKAFWIADYACGGGPFLVELAKAMPKARLVGFDGSKAMLERAATRLRKLGMEAEIMSPEKAMDPTGPRIRLVETRLPNFSLPQEKFHATCFIFPNIAPSPDEQPYYDRHGYKRAPDVAVGRMLARFREMDPEDEIGKPEDPEDVFDSLMTERVIARHARSLLRTGGFWFKADYANAGREELSELTNWKGFFSDGALVTPIKAKRSDRFFAYQGNTFRKSSVILDVYHQTKDPTDKKGGYFLTVFRAIPTLLGGG